ncbi:hypothetical protein DFH11DRAFT_783575 [Phellopilus nigrolimitatus]|nr:hypothetical protein DFH11DRAFT_783575 [Phellopilus nigrolimitatus]
MSTHSNPFVQGGWYCASSFTLGPDQSTEPPSIYGALPMTTDSGGNGSSGSSRGATHFQFTNPNPTILNSVVVSGTRELVRVSTDSRLAGYTAFRDAEGRSVALVEWGTAESRPQVQVRNAVMKGSAADWLKVVNDPRFGRPVRRMDVRGANFVWCPNGEALLLFTQTPSSNPLVVATKNRHIVDLEMSEQALTWGLLEPCIVAITLLLSGRRLE